jgi:hypothetical protein
MGGGRNSKPGRLAVRVCRSSSRSSVRPHSSSKGSPTPAEGSGSSSGSSGSDCPASTGHGGRAGRSREGHRDRPVDEDGGRGSGQRKAQPRAAADSVWRSCSADKRADEAVAGTLELAREQGRRGRRPQLAALRTGSTVAAWGRGYTAAAGGRVGLQQRAVGVWQLAADGRVRCACGCHVKRALPRCCCVRISCCSLQPAGAAARGRPGISGGVQEGSSRGGRRLQEQQQSAAAVWMGSGEGSWRCSAPCSGLSEGQDGCYCAQGLIQLGAGGVGKCRLLQDPCGCFTSTGQL